MNICDYYLHGCRDEQKIMYAIFSLNGPLSLTTAIVSSPELPSSYILMSNELGYVTARSLSSGSWRDLEAAAPSWVNIPWSDLWMWLSRREHAFFNSGSSGKTEDKRWLFSQACVISPRRKSQPTLRKSYVWPLLWGFCWPCPHCLPLSHWDQGWWTKNWFTSCLNGLEAKEEKRTPQGRVKDYPLPNKEDAQEKGVNGVGRGIRYTAV